VARLREPLAGCGRLCLCLPGYLTESQAAQCRTAFAKTRSRILGAVPSTVALALAAQAKSEDRAFVVVEVDSHVLTFGHVEVGKKGLQRADHHGALGRVKTAWWNILLNGIGEVCIRKNRRDFRDSGAAEQGIFSQLDDVLSAALRG